MDAIVAGVRAFRREYQTTAADSLGRERFGQVDARRQRYALYEALWENTAYQGGTYGVHAWSAQWKTALGLYRYAQGVFNPFHRLVEFHATHLIGGAIDPAAGDGVAVPSALPIVGAAVTDELRRAIATTWASSRWESQAVIWTRRGAMLGDTALAVRIDAQRKAIRLVPVHPRTISDVRLDDVGTVTAYAIEEVREDPRVRVADQWKGPERTVIERPVVYREVCERDGDRVVWRTFLDGMPFNWRGVDETGAALPPEWEMRLPFVPLVLAQHLDIGLDWGVSELHAGVAKAVAADDGGSMILDHIRRITRPRWLISGVGAKEAELAEKRREETEKNPQPGREDTPALFAGDAAAKAQALVGAMPIGEATAHVREILLANEQDYPELRFDRLRMEGSDVSGTALRQARKPVVTKIQTRRRGYDPVLVEAHKMAVCLGGELEFPGYEGFGLGDWGGERVAHRIGERPVFEVEPGDRLEEELEQATAVKAWVDAGVPLELALRRAGWDRDAIAEAVAAKDAAEAAALERQRSLFQLDPGAAGA